MHTSATVLDLMKKVEILTKVSIDHVLFDDNRILDVLEHISAFEHNLIVEFEMVPRNANLITAFEITRPRALSSKTPDGNKQVNK